MTTWTKTDLRRMQAGLDLAGTLTARNISDRAPDEYRERVNASLSAHALDIVRACLRSTVTSAETSPRVAAEGRAAQRLLDRLEIEPLPRELLTMPRLILHREIEAELVSLAETEEQRLFALALIEAVPTYRPNLERDLAVIRTNLADLVSRGVVEVRRATSEAFGTDTLWSDVPGIVSWKTWARPAAERRRAALGFDRCTTSEEPWSLADSTAMGRLWSAACDEETLPEVLDLRGVPESHEIMIEPWVVALAGAIRKSTRGVVLIVAGEAWPLGRTLPQCVGPA